uniref:peptidylprolyl isomerase n=1 Tax=Phaeomonas parva TaxID=124430 RepID=A0A7S1XWK7_9STRA|mmetsp:Transcript_39260/g.122890  ORF Transcript_39260/g.122890 Transcript_39260/m.122890 type:complete len:420 (+) Transcript_39260:104-1363(+)
MARGVRAVAAAVLLAAGAAAWKPLRVARGAAAGALISAGGMLAPLAPPLPQDAMTPLPGLVRPASAAVNPMQDVGIKEFLVKDGGQHLRLALPSPPGVDASKDTLRAAQINVELVKLRLEQVGARAPVWSACAKELEAAEKNIAASGALPADAATGVVNELRALKALVRSEDLAGTKRQQEVAAEALSAAREALLPPKYLPFTPEPPEEFRGLPLLKGRARVAFTLRHADGGTWVVNPGEIEEGQEIQRVKDLEVLVEVDGYHAPLTAARFVKLAAGGFYNGQKVNKAEELIVQTGERGSDKVQGGAIPLELFYKGDAAPAYSYTSDEDNRATETFSLPFQAYGALGMARLPDDADSATSQVFFVKWDQALVPPGRNTLDGFYSCFGYATKNAELLKQVQPGDVVVSAKVISGLDGLVE